MFFFFLIFLFLLEVSPLKADILSARFELFISKEKGLLQGKALFFFDKEGIYTFSQKDLEILSAKQGEESLKLYSAEKEGFFKVLVKDTKSPLLIAFEKKISFKRTPFLKIYEDYLPFPETPLSFEIVINNYSEVQESLIIPSEEEEFPNKETAILKIEKPLRNPPPIIIVNDLKKKVIDLNQKTLVFYLNPSFSERDWGVFEKNIKKRLERFEREVLSLPFKRLFIFSHFEEKALPLTLFLKKELKGDLFWDSFLTLLTEEIFRYGLLVEDKNLLKALSLYFGAYKLSENKIWYRKNLILTSSMEAQTFFYFYEILERNIGEENFDKAFKVYYEKFLANASSVKPVEVFLGDLLETKKFDLENFKRVSLKVKDFEILPVEERKGYRLRFLLVQEGTFRPLKIKLKILDEKFGKEEVIFLNRESESYEFLLKDKPKEIVLDPEYKIFRTLSYRELPHTWKSLSQLKFIAYLPQKEYYSLYRDLIEKLRPNTLALHYSQPELQTLPKENLLFLHLPPQNYHLYLPEEGFFFKILPHPLSHEHIIAIVKASSTKEIHNLLKLEDSLNNYSEFHFQGKKIVYKRIMEDSEKGITVKLTEERSYGLKPKNLESLETILPELLSSQLILIGENHNEYSHHLFQLEVIKSIYHYYPQLAIGLEMVQIPFQKYLDDFIEGKIDEKELLEKIEYYDRWKFDYPLYRDIFLFARENKIKLVALDLPSEIVKKVFKEGINSLSKEEKMLLPELDLYRPEYQSFLEKIFQKHDFKDNGTKFSYFFQAQVLRDENMAERALEFIKKNPSYKMVVLVGKGHLEYGYGIPTSLKKRNFYNFKSILLGEEEKVEPSLADYWFLPEPKAYKPSPKLGVILEEEKEGLKVKEVLKDSLAEKAGILPGDILLRADDKELKKISDLKIILTFKKEKDLLRLELLRKTQKIPIEILLE
ncbi:MAG: ChaN family lipoprotein [Caldimicrobium sp.]